MGRKLLIRDLTMRDGQQSLFATRMTQAQVNRLLPFYKYANFYAMEVWGGAVPDSVMRYLGENPWTRLETIKAAVGDVSKLTALSRGRNLFGYAPYTDEIIDGFCRNSIESGLGIMRIFDALNDVENVKSTIKYVKKYGGIADCAVCYTIDPQELETPVFTDEYFLGKAKEMAALGADMITIKDMSGLIPPTRVAGLIRLFKQHVNIPIDFHTHCTPGYGLGAVLSAIVNGVDVVDTNIWNFAGGPAAPAIELIYIFCKKLGVELDINMAAVAMINSELVDIRKELADVDAVKMFPKPFNPLTDTLPAEVEALFDKAIEAAKSDKEEELLKACHAIEAYFNFPAPDELVKKAEIPGGMYTNMVAQLKALNSEHILPKAMELIPQVRLDSGLPPLVTPTSQIVGAQAVNCALDIMNGKEMYSNVSNQFRNMVKGEYGTTPIPVDPEFRLKICGTREETPYDVSKYQMQPNPEIEGLGVKLAENEKEVLLLELFPLVAKEYLTKAKKEQYKNAPKAEKVEVAAAAATVAKSAVKGDDVTVAMPGKILQILVKPGEPVKAGQTVVILEAMKMENSITCPFDGFINNIFVAEGDIVPADSALLDVVKEAPAVSAAAPAAAAPAASSKPGKPVQSPMPGKILQVLVKPGETVKSGQPIVILEAMKMENSIPSTFDGLVNRIFVEEGQIVAADANLIDVI
jgi:pyruvate/oxaloacetate carboxyltransferase/glycine cleavage system H lipoate-binding protein